MNQQKQKKKGCKAVGRGKNHRAYQARERHPDQMLRRIIQSSGFAEAERYAEKHGLNRVLEGVQKNKVQQPNTRFLLVPVRWIERKKMEEARRKVQGLAPLGYPCGRALRRWEKFSVKQLVATPPAIK